MQIEIAKFSGFCYGVKRAIKMLDEIVEKKEVTELAYTLGPIIHNEQVTEYYEEKGIKVIENLVDFMDNRIDGVKVIVRSHGAPKTVYDQAQSLGLNLIDATCPFVTKIQKTVAAYYEKGYHIIVVGDAKHPEVIGINGWCNDSAIIINELEDIPDDLKPNEPYCIVAQTTFNMTLWSKIIDELGKILLNSIVNNTICSATEQRQTACKTLAERVDMMIVVGGKHSSNTRKLYEICSKIVKTIHIETKDDLDVSELIGNVKIGVTAGASTPDWIIQSVILKIENEGEVFFDGKS